jgi:ribosomal protein S27E
MTIGATWKEKMVEPYYSKIEKLKQKANKLRDKGKNDKAMAVEDKINSIENKIQEAVVKRERPDLLNETAVCPDCEGDQILYFDAYDKFFCTNCQRYLDV